MNRELLKAAWVRAYRSFLQAVVAQIPAGFVITPAMIEYFKVSYLYVVLAIIANAGLYALASFITCMLGGLPEVEYKKNIDMNIPEPEGSYSDGYLTEEEKAAIRAEMGGDEDV